MRLDETREEIWDIVQELLALRDALNTLADKKT